MLSRFALLTALAVSVFGCGEGDASPILPAKSQPKAVAAVSITLPEDLVQAGWSVTEIKPSKLENYNPQWLGGPAIPKFRPRYIDTLPTQAFVFQNPRQRGKRQVYVASLVMSVYPITGAKRLLAKRKRAIFAHLAELRAKPMTNDRVSPARLFWQTRTHVFFAYGSLPSTEPTGLRQCIVELLDVSTTVPVETPPKAVAAVSMTLPEDLVQAGWSVTEIKPSKLRDYNPQWSQSPGGPAIVQFRPRYIDTLPTQAFVFQNPRQRGHRHGYVPNLVMSAYPAKDAKRLLARRKRAVSAHVAELKAKPRYDDHVAPTRLVWQTQTHIFFAYGTVRWGAFGFGQRVVELLVEEPGLAETTAPLLPEVKVFTWGRGRIVLGMTKPQVLQQIERSWQRPEKDPFAGMDIPGIDRIKGEKVESKEWLLSFGPHTGHAPGGGHVRLFFVAGTLKRIRIIPTVAA